MAKLFHKNGVFALVQDSDPRDLTAKYVDAGYTGYDIVVAGPNITLRRLQVKTGTPVYTQVLASVVLE